MKVVVFGHGGDIGTAIFDHLVQAGHSVQGFTHAGCDVTKTEDVRSALGMAWSKAGGFDGVVIAHGAPGCVKPTLELTDDELRNVLEIDVLGSFVVAREATRYMATQGHGSIVLISSIHATATYPQRAAYAAAKAGVVGLMRCLAIEWAQHGMRVNCVLPGQVCETRRTQAHAANDRARQRSPSGTFVTKEDVAGAVNYLLGAAGVNGHSLVVDEGWTASAWYGDHRENA